MKGLKRLSSQRDGDFMSASHGICALPDSLITQILLNLPTKDSVKTSVLSKRWRFLWLYVPGLELYSYNFRSYSKAVPKNFIDRFMEFNRESRLQKFKIDFDEYNVSVFSIAKLIATVINHGAQHLDVETRRTSYSRDFMPLEIYKSKTLVSLKLVHVGMLNFRFVVSLPCLKIMYLEDILYNNPLILERLISGSHVLEDLTVVRGLNDNVPVLLVRSQTLKRFCVRSGSGRKIGGKSAVEVDAPRLEYMNFRDNQSDSVFAKNLSSLQMIDIDTKFNVQLDTPLVMKKSTIHGFLKGVSNVRHMIISQPTLEVLYRNLKLGPVFKFHNVSRLEASFCTLLLEGLPDILAGFRNLKHLTLYLVYLRELQPQSVQLTREPRCLRTTLETVEIREVISGEETGNNVLRNMKIWAHKKKIWMAAVRYILENSRVLKKLILCFSPRTNEIINIFKELRTFTKRSHRCEIFNQFI